MSKISVENIKCCNCEREIKVKKYDSINELFDPKLKDKLLRNELTDITCECGAILRLRYPILYHKMDLNKSIMIQYTPDNVEGIKEEYYKARAFMEKIYPSPFSRDKDVYEVYDDWDKFLERVKEIGIE